MKKIRLRGKRMRTKGKGKGRPMSVDATFVLRLDKDGKPVYGTKEQWEEMRGGA